MADLIAAEDTRRTRKLLTAFNIHTKVVAYHKDNERKQRSALVDALASGSNVALCSDAGTPGIADPGEELVDACIREGIEVEVIPGPSSVIAALVASGLPTGRFVFESFLPRRGRARDDRLTALADETRTIVLFEAPARVGATLQDLARTLGPDRRCAVCRELTKLHEEVFRATLSEAAEHFADTRGEIVLVLEGAVPRDAAVRGDALRRFIADALEDGDSVRDVAAAAAAELGVRKREAYEVALDLSEELGGRCQIPRRPPSGGIEE